ncbi:E3 ubiquitin-protein ligase TRIM33-like [Mercenaria mercenaria]|uniref:E3 ubiquitin-protein ligase TRIM33-like n=1 Tax=Mercenaria mercenaria TaxID=6596 RepID=UPI00234F161D|nr:E3 ubiquitin-protein ligase TRIM33-like [Mercenaria mercenaria]
MEVSGKRKDSSNTKTMSGSQDDVQLYCQPCQQDGLNVPAHGYCQDCAEHLCDSCYQTHRKPAPCRHHVLLDKSKMPMSQSHNQHDLIEECRWHSGNLIEYFCHQHHAFGCSACITFGHRKHPTSGFIPCISRNCKVDYIPYVCDKYVTCNEYKLLVDSLKTVKENFKKITDGAKTNKKKILENKTTVKDEIKKFHQEVNSMFVQLQELADVLFAEESARIDDIATRFDILLQDTEDLQDSVNTLEKGNKTNALYIISKTSEALVHYYTSTLENTQSNSSVNTFAFQPNLTLKKILLQSETGIGQLHKSYK